MWSKWYCVSSNTFPDTLILSYIIMDTLWRISTYYMIHHLLCAMMIRVIKADAYRWLFWCCTAYFIVTSWPFVKRWNHKQHWAFKTRAWCVPSSSRDDEVTRGLSEDLVRLGMICASRSFERSSLAFDHSLSPITLCYPRCIIRFYQFACRVLLDSSCHDN